MRRIVRMLSILLVQQALAPGICEANTRSRLPGNLGDSLPGRASSRPYLKITGALALRFSAVPPTPDYSPRTPAESASIPPVPAAGAPEAPATVAPAPPSRAPDPASVPPAESAINPPAHPTETPPTAILPDDTRPTVRPEDFLPFFQFPAGDVTVVVPASATRPPSPGQLPPSSATYQQR